MCQGGRYERARRGCHRRPDRASDRRARPAHQGHGCSPGRRCSPCTASRASACSRWCSATVPTAYAAREFVGGPQVALLPNATLLAQSWDETAAQRAGELLAGEALAQGVHVVLAPTVNLHRTPLNGRLFECYAEDPLLSGRLAAAYVRGLQRYGVAARVKHWVANESETDRHYVNSQVSEAALRELYLMPFEICVADAHPWTIMAAYNDVNGVGGHRAGRAQQRACSRASGPGTAC